MDKNELNEKQAIQRAEKAKELRIKAKKELPKYIRVGIEYFKEINRPDKSGQTIKTYAKWSKSTIVDDYGKNNLDLIKTYEGFCIVPSHTNYKAEINGFFNEYSEISYKPQKGDCSTILGLIKHLFSENYFDFALDYLKILYEFPTQRLPIILLESEEKNTGKSTFGTLLKFIFEDNAIKLGNTDIESDFNSFWLKRLCIVVDETSLEKKGIMQLLKRLSTETSTVTSNEKNKAQTQIDFYGKFFFMSNDEGKALPIEKGDTRFAVFKVPTFKQNNVTEIPNIEEVLKKEIPSFLDYLLTRQLKFEEKSRMYFDTSVYQTEQLLKYFKNNISYMAKAIQNLMKDYFEFFENEEEIKLSTSNLMYELKNGGYIRQFDKQQIKKALSELGLEELTKQRYTYQSLNNTQNSGSHMPVNSNNRIYLFEKINFKNT